MHDDVKAPKPGPSGGVMAELAEHHHAFLAFVQRRVGARDLAEEIVQTALVKNLEKVDTIRDSAVSWFYAVLRNAIVDYHRRSAATDRCLRGYAAEARAQDEQEGDRRRVVCNCVGKLVTSLKPEYADALRQIEVEGVSVKDYAERVGISVNNAGVRVFRARKALHREVVRSCGPCATHGCHDCTCGTSRARESAARRIDP